MIRTVGHTVAMTSADLISIDPRACHGQPWVRDARVLVSVVLDALAADLSPAEIAQHYPTLTEADVDAVAADGG